MTDRSKFEQMLEFLIAEEQDKAKELFHQIVVEKSREIYENILAEDFNEAKEEDEEMDEAKAEDDEEQVDEATAEDEDDDEMDESFGFAEEADEDSEDGEGGDAGDDFINDIEAGDEGDEEGMDGEDDLEDRVVDLEDALDDLRAEFEQLMADEGGDDMGGDDMGGMKADDDMELESGMDSFMREYVEKVSAGHGAEKKGSGESAANTKSPVAGKNDMGGTTANIAKGGEGGGKDSGLSNSKPKDMNTGNINVPGGKAGSAFNKKEPGHGAEKKGSGESAANTKSIIGGK